jgi:hypothetical protein
LFITHYFNSSDLILKNLENKSPRDNINLKDVFSSSLYDVFIEEKDKYLSEFKDLTKESLKEFLLDFNLSEKSVGDFHLAVCFGKTKQYLNQGNEKASNKRKIVNAKVLAE